MSLINLKDLLNHAKSNKYAVGAFAVANMDFIDLLLDSAVEKKSPIILLLAEVHFKYIDIEKFSSVVTDAAKKINIPVCLGLDHGQKFETAIKAIKCGFTSIMFDASEYPLEENIKMTKEVVKIAHSVNVSVEGEIGYIGRESDGSDSSESQSLNKELFTKVNEAIRYYDETDVDALAVSIGNMHGIYKGEPKLDFERLDELNKALNIPLVLHGGSGISNEDYKKAINLGICKINYFTQMSVEAVDRIRYFLGQNQKFNSYPDLIKIALNEVEKDVREKLDVFGSSGQIISKNTICLTCKDNLCGINNPLLNQNNYDIFLKHISKKISDNVFKLLR